MTDHGYIRYRGCQVYSRDLIPAFVRSGGDTVCAFCSKPYYDHPKHLFTDHPEHDDGLILTRTCDDRYHKL